MGDTPGKASDGLHLLGLAELLFTPLQRLFSDPALRHITDDPDNPSDLSLGTSQWPIGLIGDQGDVLPQLVRQVGSPLRLPCHGTPHHPLDTHTLQMREDLPKA